MTHPYPRLILPPLMHRLLLAGRKSVHRLLAKRSRSCQYLPGIDVICLTQWRVDKEFDRLYPEQLPANVQIDWSSGPIAHWCPERGRSRQARSFPRSLEHLAPKRTIVSVRLEKLRDITFEDALREGLEEASSVPYGNYREDTIESFGEMINDVHGPGTWARNPDVWRIELETPKQERAT